MRARVSFKDDCSMFRDEFEGGRKTVEPLITVWNHIPKGISMENPDLEFFFQNRDSTQARSFF
jgi:hypothetical protein